MYQLLDLGVSLGLVEVALLAVGHDLQDRIARRPATKVDRLTYQTKS